MELQRSGKRKLKGWVRGSIVAVTTIFLLFVGGHAGAFLVDSYLGLNGVRETEEGDTLDNAHTMRTDGQQISINWDEQQALAVMNKMTHQKIKAADKWGAIEMTPERIEEMLIIVAENNYHFEDEMNNILEKWLSGDFTKVDEDHNAILEMQGGNVGHAYGIYSAEDERKFIKNTFNK